LWINNIILSVITVIYAIGQPDKEAVVNEVHATLVGIDGSASIIAPA